MSSKLQIRRATPDSGAELTRIALASKAHWGYDRDFMARAAPFLVVDGRYIEDHDVWVVERDGRPVGFYALIHQDRLSILDHLWLQPTDIGHGLGRRLFEHARERAAARGSLRLELEAEPGAVGFYKRMGGRPVRTVTTELGRQFEVYSFDLGDDAGGSGGASSSAAGALDGPASGTPSGG
jgi:GNAT superfamily N-acetyltransferase